MKKTGRLATVPPWPCSIAEMPSAASAKHTEGVSAGPSDQKQDEKQAGDDEPCPTFMLSHCYLRQIVARRVRPSCSTCTGFGLCHPRSASVRGQIHAHFHFGFGAPSSQNVASASGATPLLL